MRGESDIYRQLQATEAEVQQLYGEIDTLRLRVKAGMDDWRQSLDTLAVRAERRRTLEAQQEALRWVLALVAGRRAELRQPA